MTEHMRERTVGEMVRHKSFGCIACIVVALAYLIVMPIQVFAGHEESILEKVQSRQEIKRVVSNVSSELVESYVAEPLELASDTLESLYGISPEIYESFYGEFSSIENTLDTFIIVKTSDKEVENLFNDYVFKMENSSSLVDTKQIKNASVASVNGYTIFSMLGSKEESAEALSIAEDILEN